MSADEVRIWMRIASSEGRDDWYRELREKLKKLEAP